MDNANNQKVGIVSMECYFPKYYVSQSEFETFNGVSSGKYTIGLGQNAMSFVTDAEDICSISMTVLSNLMSKNKISYGDISWICVATETIIDHSKSISSSLMKLFEEKGNTEIEGVDVKHACYAGTFALFSAFNRITSSYWDGKYCIVIAADIAEYSQGPARVTGGCGAVALLIGKNGCIKLNKLRSTFKANQYDFYKPNLNSPYPIINGHVSNQCYLNAIDSCYKSYYNKTENPNEFSPFNKNNYWIFHSPYNKLVSKAAGRIIYNHFLKNPSFYYDKYSNNQQMLQFLKKYENSLCKQTINSREVIKGFEKIAKELNFYNKYVEPSTFLPKNIGNCYTASIFIGLTSLIYKKWNELCGKNIYIFSYGSGTIASLYSLQIANSNSASNQLKKIVTNNNIKQRLSERNKIECDRFTKILNGKINKFHNENLVLKKDFIPQINEINEDNFYPNTFYLQKIDVSKRRFYEKYTDKGVSKLMKRIEINAENNNILKALQTEDNNNIGIETKYVKLTAFA